MGNRVKLVLAIRALDIGGAERQFLEIVKNISTQEFDVFVITTHKGILDSEIGRVPNFCANKRTKLDIKSLWKVRNSIKKFKPDAIYSFMPDMNITMAIIRLFLPKSFKLIWGQFGSEPDFTAYGLIRKRIYQIQRYFEFLSDAIISDGSRGIDFLRKFRYKLNSSIVIVSGTDVHRFKRNEIKREEFRRSYNLRDNSIAIGTCSRLDPMKGYIVFSKVAQRILTKYPNTIFFSIGYGQDQIMEEAKLLLGEVSDRFIWLGKQVSPEHILSGWDIYCSNSLYGEGFSNSIIEAMACSLPIIATDVGDAAYQLENVGKVLPPGDEDRFFLALDEWITSGSYLDCGTKSRERVITNFSSKLMTKRTEEYILEIINK